MDKVVPWDQLCALIEPFYPKAGKGRPPVGLERMLRIYFLQHWFNLSDPGAEEALYESRSMCRFAGIDLGREPVPDESTLLNFRHLLERHELGEALFQAVGEYLQERGLRIASGTIVDASIISAPSSTRNKDKARNRTKSKVRAKVEHVFGVIKRVFGFTKVRYRGLAKNAHALFVLCALTNLYMARRRLRCLA